MNRQVLKFEPNQPLTVALEFPDGVNVQGFGGPQVKFSLTGLRVLYADPELAQAIRTLGVKPGELFKITKRRESGKSPWWDLARVKTAAAALEASAVSRTPETPRTSPATQQTPVSAPTPVLLPGDVKRLPPQTTREQPPPAGGMYLTKTHPLKPSYEDAFRECLRIVTAGLQEFGEHWSDHSVQAMTSTLFIQAARDGRLQFNPQAPAKVA